MSKKILLTATIFVFLLTAGNAFAAESLEIVDLPTQIQAGTSFDISVEIAAVPSTSYYIKSRGGAALNNLIKVSTYNSVTKTWLTDTSSWTKFPTITTDGQGLWQGKLTVKFTNTASNGVSYVLIRLRKTDTQTNLDSPAKEIVVTAAVAQPSSENPNPSTSNINNSSVKVMLNEFSPAPVGNKEWVELSNFGPTNANVGGWKIDDIPKGSSAFVIPENTIIDTGSYQVFYFSSKLNNTGDSVRLLDPADTQVEIFSFDQVDKGTVFAKDSQGKWKITTTPTPGEKNKITSPPQRAASKSTSEVGSFPTSFFPTSNQNYESLSSIPQVLGVENPGSTFIQPSTNQSTKPQVASSTQVFGNKPTSTILIGLGLIFLGIATGLPLLTAATALKWR